LDKRRKNYIILASTIVVIFFCTNMVKTLGVALHSPMARTLITILLYSPVVAFLIYLSKDTRLKRFWIITLRILAIQLVLANIIGIILVWFL